MKRLNVLVLGLLAAWIAASMAAPALAPGQLSRPHLSVSVIPSVPGGVHDVIGRVWAERIKSHFGTIVIDNRGGGGGLIGANDVAPRAAQWLQHPAGQHVDLRPAHARHGRIRLIHPVKDFSAVAVFAYSSTSIVVNPSRAGALDQGAD